MTDALATMTPLAEAGAIGGALFDATGQLVAHTMPAYFPVEALRSAGGRIVILLETVNENFEPISEIVLGFEGHLILLRRSPSAVLAVVMPETANREAVKLATNLVFRRLAAPRPAPAAPPSTRRLPPQGPAVQPKQPASPAAPKPKKKSDIWGD